MTRVIGLTGGIGSGKSTVARLLRERGQPVVDADELAREVVRPGEPAWRDIVRTFGGEVLVPGEGELRAIDRGKLAGRVFGDATARRALEAITHPRIAAAAQEALTRHRAAGVALVFYEAALLVENRLHRIPGLLDGVIVVSLPAEEAVRRALERGGTDEADVRARIAAQLPLDEKVAAADYVIDNRGTRAELAARVDAVLADLLAGGPARRATTPT